MATPNMLNRLSKTNQVLMREQILMDTGGHLS